MRWCFRRSNEEKTKYLYNFSFKTNLIYLSIRYSILKSVANMTKEESKQISLTLDNDFLNELEKFRQEHHLSTVQDAIRMLISQGLKVYKKGEKA